MNFLPAVIAASLVVLFAFPPSLLGDSVIIYGDRGSFNRGYRSYEYKDRPRLTFPVDMTSLGGEVSLTGPGGYTWGGGISTVEISEGTKQNWIYTERQEKTSIFVPYFFVGYDFSIIAVELGLSYYLTSRTEEGRDYDAPDGSAIRKGESIFFDRNRSYVFNNACVRILKKEFIHFKIRYGREQFNAVDSLFNIAMVIPLSSSSFEVFMANPGGGNRYFPKTNQRAGLSWIYDFGPFSAGLTLSSLLGNYAGGGGAGTLSFVGMERYSAGFQAGMKWQ